MSDFLIRFFPAPRRRKILCALLAVLSTAFLVTSCSKESRKAGALSRADRYLKLGQFDQAKVEYLNLLHLDNQNAEAYQNLGLIWFEEGAPLRAAPFLLKSREIAPNNFENRVRLARVFLFVGRRTDAFQEAMNILERSPGNGDAVWVAAQAAQTPAELDRLQQEIARFPNQDNVSFQLARAAIALRKGDRQAAEEAGRKALAADPRSASAHLFMATLLLVQKDLDKARNEFKTASDLAAPRSAERLRYAQFCAQSGNVDQAVELLRSITSAAPDYLPAWNILAELALGRKSYDESLKLLENVLNRDPDNLDANMIQGRVWLARGDKEKATGAFERLDAKYPGFAPVKLQLARCYLESNNPNQAIAVLNQAIKANPDLVEASLLLAQINVRTGNMKSVVESMRGLLKKHPESREAKLLLADAYRGLNQLDDAAAIFRDEIKNSPNDAQAYTALGLILCQQKKNPEAREALEKARALAPNNPISLFQLVDLDISTKDFESATRLVHEQLERTPKSAVAYFLEGKIEAAQSKWDLAQAALTQSIGFNPNFSPAYALLASSYLATNKLPDAARQLEELLSKNPKDSRALMTLGIIQEKLSDFAKARDAYEKVLAISPNFTPALNNLAFLYAEHLNQPQRAYELAKKARDLQPGDAAIADTLGWALYKGGHYREAIPLLQESAAKSPNESEIQYHLGMAHYMMGRKEAARAAFELAASSNKDFSGKADVSVRLALLGEESSSSNLSLDQLKSIVHERPDDIGAQVRLAQIYQAQHASKDAAATYEEVLKQNPKMITALTSLAELYSGPLNDNAKALEYAKKAREISPSDKRINVLLGRIAYQAGNYDWAYSLLEPAVREMPDDPEALHELAWSEFSLGKITAATQHMTHIAAIAPASPQAADAKTFLAMINIEQNPAGANATAGGVENVLKTNPNYLPAEFARAAMDTARGDLDGAATVYQQILKQSPDLPLAQKRLAALYAQRDTDLQKANDIALEARKNLPDDPEIARILGGIRYRRQEYSAALQLLRESAQKEPLDANSLFYAGMCLVQTKQEPEARKSLNQALAAGLKGPLADEARRALQQLGKN